MIHADRIRDLSVEHRHNFLIAPEVALILWRNAPTELLFPNMRKFASSCEEVEEMELVPMFIGHSLQDFEIVVSRADNDVFLAIFQPTFDVIAEKCPNITRIKISIETSFGNPMPSLFGPISDFVCRYRGLQEIDICTVQFTPRAIEHVASLPNLRRLTCSPQRSSSATLVADGMFPALEYYSQECSPFPAEDLESFSSTISMMTQTQTKLKELRVCIRNCDGNAAYLRRLTSLMAQSYWHRSLETIRLIGLGPVPFGFPVVEVPAMDLADLGPLLSLRNVTHFTMDFSLSNPQFNLHDDAMFAVASSWPSLKVLDIRVEEIKATMKSVIALLEGCQELKFLHLQVDFRSHGSELDMGKIYPHKLKLNVVDSSLEEADTSHLAAWFIRCLPNITHLRWSVGGTNRKLWRRVCGEVEGKHVLYLAKRLPDSFTAALVRELY